ncbi:unnamed protein product [Psylliodes chrysocephalus]|uniref:Forkhead box protein O n=1 Tax=Psylliodes chrysocephalus TaxID=3402493 RepID=A0A9P0GFH6_9CUCU|nr:unnamed protein product [Psylliodes chrysocephala]
MESNGIQDNAAFRNRSSTWHGKVKLEPGLQPVTEEDRSKRHGLLGRRNIYGQQSYSDLIIKAINSTPDKKMTLSQIYEWMMVNVPVLSNKPEGMASWKNSVRHNLSLHCKFVKVPNPSAGKSSFWTVNLDVKPIKPARRRTGSLETNKFNSKQQRAKRAAHNTKISPAVYSNAQLMETAEPYVLPGYQVSPVFRTRTWSDESTYSQPSPIPSEEVLVNIPNQRLDIPMQYHYQPLYSSSGQISPDYPETMRRYWTKPSAMSQRIHSSPYVRDERNLDLLSNNFQCNVTLENAQIDDRNAEENPNFYHDNDTGYQYAMNIIHAGVRPETLDLVADVDNIQVDLLKSPLECNVDEVINQELRMGETIDFV